ncbi:MAG TPA: sulfotransferase [Rudaea sp.]|nr:sulfotransferase [Rudaea sp.]
MAAVKPTPALSPPSRLHGLSQQAVGSVVAAAQALDRGRADEADRHIIGLLALYPEHPEVLRLHAGVLRLRGNYGDAVATLRHAITLRPQDALYLNTLGSVFIETAQYDDAIAILEQACALDPELASARYNLGLALMRCMRVDESATALRRALTLSPDIAISAHAILGDMFRADGRFDEAVAEYRLALARQSHAGMAWWGLADIKTQKFSDDDIERLRKALHNQAAGEDDFVAMEFALAKALDERGRFAESLAALERGNARARKRTRWNAEAYSAQIDSIIRTFTPPPNGAASDIGNEVIFIVSMPRSGSTLIEQVLASHSMVDGAGELADLPIVLTEEAQRRRKPFPEFVHELDAADWEHLGRRYLERTARWRRNRPRFTDKLPGNWPYVGAIRAMLPQARIVIGRRDPLETCFSCYRQRLAHNEYTRTFSDLASAWRDFDRAATHWRAQYPTHVYENVYEDLVVDPGTKIRELLAFCGLPFEDGCLRFYENRRGVHTPSAAQVRQPLRRDTARTRDYGALLDPLRSALSLPPFSAT